MCECLPVDSYKAPAKSFLQRILDDIGSGAMMRRMHMVQGVKY
jgi:hypothetical protein